MFTTQTITIEILKTRLVQLNTLVGKLNKRAAKIGVPALKTKVIGDSHIGSTSNGMKAEFINVEITGNIPSYNGWNILGIIDHLEDGNIIKNLSKDGSIEIPEMYRTRSTCDHCNTNHRRNKTILIRSTSGEIKQVGTSCINDFIQRDVEDVVAFLGWDSKITDFGDVEDCAGGRIEYGEELDTLIAASIRVIKSVGFKKSAEENSTKSDLEYYFYNNTEGAAKFRAYCYERTESIDVDTKTVEIINWMQNLDGSSSDFFNNLKVLASGKFVAIKYWGFIAAGVFTFLKMEDDRKALENSNEINDYLPNVKVKDRVKVICTLTSIRPIDGYYGITYLHTFKDQDGRIINWFATSNPMDDSDVGQIMTITGTVKKLDEYNGEKQTMLTRVKRF